MSYFGYVAPDINKEVNWAKIGTDFADMLNKGEADREAKRQEIDKQTDEFVKMLNEAPQGQYASLNQWTLDYASDVKKSMLLLNRELKSGRLDPDRFIKNRQNLTDGTNSIFNLSKTWQAEYDTIEKRRLDGTGSFIEQDIAAQVEKLGRFKESKPFVNPTDYSVLIGSVGADGKVNTNPYDAKSPAVMTGLLKTRYNKFNTLDSAKKIADAAGKEIQVVNTGAVRRILDITKRRDLTDVDKKDKAIGLYLRLEDAAVGSALSDPDAITSVLVDTKLVNPKTGNAYELTYDPSQAGGDKIYMEFDKGSGKYISKPTNEQKDVAFKTLKDAVRYQLDREEEAKQQFAPQQPQQWQYQAGVKKRSDTEAANMAAQLYYGDNAQVSAALDYFKGLMPNVSSLEKTSDGNISITYTDGTKSSIGMQGKTIQDFVRSATEITGIQDIDQALRSVRIPTGAVYNPNTGASIRTAGTSPSTDDPKAIWSTKVKQVVPAIDTDEDNALDQLKPLSAYGFKVRIPWTAGDAIAIKTPSGQETEFDLSDPQAIYTFLEESLTPEQIVKLGIVPVKASSFNKK